MRRNNSLLLEFVIVTVMISLICAVAIPMLMKKDPLISKEVNINNASIIIRGDYYPFNNVQDINIDTRKIRVV